MCRRRATARSEVVRHLGDAFIAWGAFIGICALQWWWLTYAGTLDSGLLSIRDAAACALSERDVCALARLHCRAVDPTCPGDYSAVSMWLGLLLLWAGATMTGWRW